MINPRRYFPLLLAVIPSGGMLAASPPEIAFFEKHIRPALVEHCYECHSAGARKLKAGLRLDFKGGWEQGGESGPAIIPGKPDESRLIEAIRYHNADLEMPPKGALAPQVVEKFVEWVERGAADPRHDGGPAVAETRQIDLELGRRFWSFAPRENPPPPEAANSEWPRDPLDHFILARLEAAGLQPAADASPFALLRRLHLDLTGLPPSIGEIERFMAHHDQSPRAAIEAKVDQLLSDPAFGERWGRHWLDLARYADSTGGGRAIPLPDAWRYRDYVINAFAEDRPLDELIREHIAGDLLPYQNEEARRRNLTATGFLLLGPHNYENQDKELLEFEIIDEQLDTIGRSFLGMAIGCARCHDHKSDPIPTSDYYAMAGIMKSTKFVKHSNVSAWHKVPLTLGPREREIKETTEKEIKNTEKRLKDARDTIKKLAPEEEANPKSVDAAGLAGIILDNREASLQGAWMRSQSSASFVGAEYIHDKHEKMTEKSATYRPEIATAGRYEVRISYSPGSNRPTNTPVVVHHAEGDARVLVNQQKKPAIDGLFHSLGVYPFAAGKDGFIRISNEGTQGAVIADAVQLLPQGREIAKKAPQKPAEPAPAVQARLTEERKLAADLEKQLKELRARLPKATTLMAVEDGTPADTQVRIRGMVRNLGDSVPRGVLQVAQRPDSLVKIEAGSGRRELADWIASADNPLTARVLANRIWLHLFGYGIVRTPDNFGSTGGPPSHPALLDHLAQELIDGGWSTKHLIRTIVLSRTYQVGATPAKQAREIDPQNLLLSHAHRRSIDAEVLRDSILRLAGRLEQSSGGPSLPAGFKSEFGFKFDSLKRSVYIPVFRNSLHEVFSTFDFANPNFTMGHRTTSTIPTQQLFLSNSPFIHEQAAAAARILQDLEAPDDSARIRLAYLRTLGRPPNGEELSLSLDFLRTRGGNAPAWAALQRALFLTLDFRYLP